MKLPDDLLLSGLAKWRDDLAQEAAARGEEMFMGLPDYWYGNPHWFCVNGHVSQVVLRREGGPSRCLACRGVVVIGPALSEEDFAPVLAEIAQRVAGA